MAEEHMKTQPNPVKAIDILLEPDATMIKNATAANERLLKNFPKGFALGKTHQPHISCLQRYVKTSDLDKVYVAVGKVLAEEKPTSWKLKAYKYYYIPWEELGLAGIVIEPSDDLITYQKKLIDAVEPFTVKTGNAAAYVTTKEDPDINHMERRGGEVEDPRSRRACDKTGRRRLLAARGARRDLRQRWDTLVRTAVAGTGLLSHRSREGTR